MVGYKDTTIEDERKLLVRTEELNRVTRLNLGEEIPIRCSTGGRKGLELLTGFNIVDSMQISVLVSSNAIGVNNKNYLDLAKKLKELYESETGEKWKIQKEY